MSVRPVTLLRHLNFIIIMHRPFKSISITVVSLIVSIWALLFFSPAPPLLSGMDYSKAVYDNHQQLLRLTLSSDGKYRLPTPLADISPLAKAATLLQEDQYFQWHIGFNPVSLFKAAWRTYIKGSRRMGGSTITMQVAHIRYGINSKTLSGKCWQIIRALQLEVHYSKNEILEAYLNLAPYGNNIEGIGAASLIYFGKPARDLSLSEALTLVVIPQNPTKRIPDRGYLKEVRNKLFSRWVMRHPNDKNKIAIMQLPLQIRSVRDAPFLAPHFVNDVLANKNNNSHQIMTTLDYSIQQLVERVARRYIARKNHLGVKNASVLILDTRDMNIKAMMGSVDFFNKHIGGQINGTSIKRSPGSTLKPFIYALAIDQSLIHPGTVLKDVPHRFGSYNPENFDNDFVGPISAKEALMLSRNIPAIYLAEQLTHPSLYSFLQSANIHDLKSETYYGLALVLGGAELTMKELVSLYAMLANRGVWQPLRDIQTAENIPGKSLLSPEASFLILDMLKEVGFAKTGTSSGYRDAWTIGLVGPYVVAVWIGNFNNQGNHVFIGKEIAAPLFMEVAHALQSKLGPFAALYPNPERLHLTKIDVCKASGMLPTRYCHDTTSEWFIPGKSPIKTDTIYREITVDSKTGLRTCHFDDNTRFEIYEFWPSDLLKIFKRAGIQRRTPPAYDPTCIVGSKVGMGFSPQITSPQTQVSYISKLDANSKTIIPLSAVVDADVKNLHWFLNESYLGKSPRNKIFLWHAHPGKYTIRIVDDFGRSDARDVIVAKN
jgi:penicillin-binding protein 1C